MPKVINFSLEAVRNLIQSENDYDFDAIADQVFALQAEYNPVYQEFVSLFGTSDPYLSRFLPIETFKQHHIRTGNWQEEAIFMSSGTTGQDASKHLVRSLDAYHQGAIRDFEYFFGELKGSCILALLPHYLERGNSSLVSMVKAFIDRSGHEESGFFLHDMEALKVRLDQNSANGVPTILFGVTYALMTLCNQEDNLPTYENLLVIETGGMKGRGPEITREELHNLLRSRFPNATISSEYGMTEMMSQAYLKKDGFFYPGKNLRVIVSEINDPFAREKNGKTGVINLVDLGNLDTCSFIKTQDLGRLNDRGGFQVLGRLDHSDLRGCNLMVQDL